ncbi:MAG: DUF4476 domain-containing protein [Bacteroidota bacterium]|nr:DUF4476 domain-containing protein [Bacteroidota bacterium]
MKKSILILSSLVLMALNTLAQGTYNVILFAEDGDAFYLYANGIRQNDKPETNVKITGLNAQVLNLKVEFENKALPQLKKNMPLEPGNEYTIRIKKDMKKQMKLQYFGQVALADAPKSNASTVQYHTAENPIETTSASNNASNTQFNTSSGGDHANTSVTTTSTTTQINMGTNTNPNGVGVNVNVNGLGINMNVNDPNMQSSSTSYTTTTTTVSSSSSSSNSQPKKSHNYEHQSNPTTMPVENTQPTSSTNSGCKFAMNDASFQKMKKSVDDKPFADTKMSTAKVATKNACLSAEQIKDICSLFSMDEDKLTYAKYAYSYCVDKANFYHISEIFSFSSTTDELNKFIEEQ